MTSTSKKNAAQAVPIAEFLRSELEREGWDKEEFGKKVGVSRATIYNILNGSTKISRKNAGRIAEALGHSHDFWMRREVFVGDDSNVIPLRAGDEPGMASTGEGNAPELLTDEMIEWAVREDRFSISSFNSEQVKSASYDLTLHPRVTLLSPTGRRVQDLAERDFELDHLQSAAISTFEKIEFPKHYMARVGPTAELAKMGIVVNTGLQIDPGFSGHLEASIVNFSGRTIKLFQRQVIMSIEIFRLPVPPKIGYHEDPEGSSLFTLIRDEVASQLRFEQLDDGKIRGSWDAANLEWQDAGGQGEAIASAISLIAEKADEAPENSALLKQLDRICSYILPSRATLEQAVKELAGLGAGEFGLEPQAVGKFVEGRETLRSALKQSSIDVHLFVIAALRHNS